MPLHLFKQYLFKVCISFLKLIKIILVDVKAYMHFIVVGVLLFFGFYVNRFFDEIIFFKIIFINVQSCSSSFSYRYVNF